MSTTKSEQAVTFAALILADDGIAITPEKLQALIEAANIEDVEPVWTTLFAKALEGKNVHDILTKVESTTAQPQKVAAAGESSEGSGKGGEERVDTDVDGGSDDEGFDLSLFD